jgi:uncharacterized spore protein YtfJ
MALRELVDSATEAATVKRVFGQPIERDGATVIPVASVRGGFGGGEAESSVQPSDASQPRPHDWGGGGAWSASPAGVYVLKDGAATWVPAVDANRTILLGCLTGIVSLLVIRSIVRTLAKRG